MSTLRVKICGITRPEDALLACELGADAIGFIFYRPSPRYISPQKAFEISRQLPEHVARVGVFVEEDDRFIFHVAQEVPLDVIQFHGNHSPAFMQPFQGYRRIKAFRVRHSLDAAHLAAYRDVADAFLLDTYRQGQFGGTGVSFDWKLAQPIRKAFRLILAGGLNATNVRQAVETVKPYGIDVSSGIESAPGRKDAKKMRTFFEQVEALRDHDKTSHHRFPCS